MDNRQLLPMGTPSASLSARLIEVEADLAVRFVVMALAEGFSVSVNDGEEWVVKRSLDVAVIVDALGSTDADTLKLRDADGIDCGSALLVWGNGEDLFSDWCDRSAVDRLLHSLLGLGTWH